MHFQQLLDLGANVSLTEYWSDLISCCVGLVDVIVYILPNLMYPPQLLVHQDRYSQYFDTFDPSLKNSLPLGMCPIQEMFGEWKETNNTMQAVDGEWVHSLELKCTTMPRICWRSLSCVPLPLKTTEGFIFVLLACAVRRTLKWFFSSPADFCGRVCLPVSATVVSEGIPIQHAYCLIRGKDSVQWIAVLHLESSKAHDEANQLGMQSAGVVWLTAVFH